MSKYIDAEKLIEGIKHLQSKFPVITYAALFHLIASLQQEQPNKYETALEKAREWMPNINQGGHAMLIDIFPELGENLDPSYGGRKQEQPEVDLEKEMTTYIERHFHIRYDETLEVGNDPLTTHDFEEIARHFYELGKNARKV